MIAFLGPVRLIYEMIVLDQLGIPLIGLAADESVEAVITQTERP
jgi:hypothetical protein